MAVPASSASTSIALLRVDAGAHELATRVASALDGSSRLAPRVALAQDEHQTSVTSCSHARFLRNAIAKEAAASSSFEASEADPASPAGTLHERRQASRAIPRRGFRADVSPFVSPSPCFWLCRAKEQRNHNPRVGGSSPSSGMRSACRSCCLARFSRERDTRNHVASGAHVTPRFRLSAVRANRGTVRSCPPACPPRTRSDGPLHPADTPCDCETSGAPNGACFLGLTARDRPDDRRCG
jgi:hypothetical protein